MEIKIRKEFHDLKHGIDFTPYLVGEPKQFIVDGGDYLCIRDGCEGCPYQGQGCESEPRETIPLVNPSSRRAVGFEQTPFLVLKLKSGFIFATPDPGDLEDEGLMARYVPQRLWNTIADPMSLDERNLHFVLSDLNHCFRVMKGQYRFYGTQEQFEASEYANYFRVYGEYHRQHAVVALDFSAIEPRVSSLASRTAAWLRVFEGEPKEVVREVSLKKLSPGLEDHTVLRGDTTYCFLMGELDKESYDKQCKKCLARETCKTLKTYSKNVCKDWHGLNRDAFYADEIINLDLSSEEGKVFLKEKRNISKICGLAINYGGTAYTVCGNMGCSKERAQVYIDNFFSTLPDLQQWMMFQEMNVKKTGKVQNLFGRIRNMQKWAWSKSENRKQVYQDLGYAIRTSYNHPIQSTSSDLLNIAMIRAHEFIESRGLSPYYIKNIADGIQGKLYTDCLCTLLTSIHDELDFQILVEAFDSVIPEVYEILQCRDVIKSLGVDFDLEMDVEYDHWGAFTATTKYDGARVYLLNLLKNFGEVQSTPANALVVNFPDLTQDLLENKGLDSQGFVEYILGIKSEHELYVAPFKVTEELLQKLGIAYRRGVLKDDPVSTADLATGG